MDSERGYLELRFLYMERRFNILYRYFIALREIYQNVCPEVPGNPRDVIFPDAEGRGKYNISGIPGSAEGNITSREFPGTEGQTFWYISREAMK